MSELNSSSHTASLNEHVLSEDVGMGRIDRLVVNSDCMTKLCHDF